ARGADHRRQISDVPPDDREPTLERLGESEVRPRARREIVEDAHAGAVVEEPFHEVRADEAGAASHQNYVVHSPIVSSCSVPAGKDSIASASALSSSGGTSSPVSPWATTSRWPGTSLAITGSRDAIASNGASGSPSFAEGVT